MRRSTNGQYIEVRNELYQLWILNFMTFYLWFVKKISQSETGSNSKILNLITLKTTVMSPNTGLSAIDCLLLVVMIIKKKRSTRTNFTVNGGQSEWTSTFLSQTVLGKKFKWVILDCENEFHSDLNSINN